MVLDLKYRSNLSIAAFAITSGLIGCVPGSLSRSGSVGGPPLATVPESLSLGRLEPGQKASARLILRNRTSRQFSVTRVEASCPCIGASPSAFGIGPRGQSTLAITFDPSEDPGFRGGLSVGLVGFGDNGDVLFRATIELEVGRMDVRMSNPDSVPLLVPL